MEQSQLICCELGKHQWSVVTTRLQGQWTCRVTVRQWKRERGV